VRLTYHLTPVEWWEGATTDEPLAAPSLSDEGFIHCTDGGEAMVATANRHYRDDPRSFVIHTIDLDRVGSRWSVDDPGRIYPHIHGPIDRAAIVEVRPAPRGPDGEFLPFD
jgi:uncharacterized protein (DUF952 family)